MDDLQIEVPGRGGKKITIPASTVTRKNASLPSFTHEGEALYWLLADWRGKGALADMRASAMGRAIDAKDKCQPEWNQYSQLAAPTKDYCKAKWDAADKVIRHCVIDAPQPATLGKNKNKKKFRNTDYLLPHTKDALHGVDAKNGFKVIIREEISGCPIASVRDEFRVSFDQEIELRISNQRFGLNAGIDEMCSCPERDKGRVFYAVIDVDGSDPELETEGMLRYLYGRLAGDEASHEAIATKYIGENHVGNDESCMTGVAGIVGMEGALFVRNLNEYSRLAEECSVAAPNETLFFSSDNDNKDELWGGSVFQLFLISFFQRKRLEVAAKQASENWREPDIDKKKIKVNLEQMMRLDNIWMYQEMAARTDIDRIYRTCQDALDIPEMWQDIRDQMGRASDFLDRESAKSIEKIVTVLTVIGLPLAFFTALITVSDINDKSASHQFFGAGGVLLLAMLVVYSLWPFEKVQQVNLSRLVKLFFGVLTLIFIVCASGILLLESWKFSISFLP